MPASLEVKRYSFDAHGALRVLAGRIKGTVNGHFDSDELCGSLTNAELFREISSPQSMRNGIRDEARKILGDAINQAKKDNITPDWEIVEGLMKYSEQVGRYEAPLR